MQNNGMLTIAHGKQTLNIPLSKVLYVIMDGNNAFIHMSKDTVHQVRMTLSEIEPILGDNFIKVKRGCLVSAIAIHGFTDMVDLINGERLEYAVRHKKEIIEKFQEKQRQMISGFKEEVKLNTLEEYHEYYKVFDNFPVAFCDIEMVFDGQDKVVDWIFCYCNPALAKLEKFPLQDIVGKSFSSLFHNMDTKWLKSYEQAALFGETVKIIDYSPEIDTYLDIICFPTFKGHCGCILTDISKINTYRNATENEKAIALLFKKLLGVD